MIRKRPLSPPARPLGLPMALLAALAAGAEARSLMPGPVPQGVQVAGRAIDSTQGGLRVRVEALEPSQAGEWMRARSRGGRLLPGLLEQAADPAPPPGTPAPRKRKPAAPLLVFAVSFENGTGEDVTFVPELSVLTDDHGVEHSALPGDFLRVALRDAFAALEDPDAAADDAMSAIHAGPLILRPGERASRALIFGPQEKARRLVLTLGHIALGARDVSPAFPFMAIE